MSNVSILFLGTGTEANDSKTEELPTSFLFRTSTISILVEPTSALRVILSGNSKLTFPDGGFFSGRPNIFMSSSRRPGELLALIHCLLYFDARQKHVTVFGPYGIRSSLTRALDGIDVGFSTFWEIIELPPSRLVKLDDSCSFTTLPLVPNSTHFDLGLALTIKPKVRVDREKFERLGLKQGPDISRVISGEVVRGVSLEMILLGPQQSPTRVTYLPGMPTQEVWTASHMKSATLIARIPYLDEHLDLATEKGMLTASEIGRLARVHNVEKVVPVARSSRVSRESWMRNEIEQFGVNVLFPRFGESLEV